ncbi:cobalamin biosynthesis protein CobT, partial [Acinetobacter baumannii]
ALSNVLDRLKIPHEVICFTTHTDSATYHKRLKQIREAEKKYGVSYSRYENLYMPVIKGYNERINTETKRRFGWLPHSGLMASNI